MMKVPGLLWYDNGGSLADRARRAAHRYERKFGQTPDICYVHPSAFPSSNGEVVAGQMMVGNIEICPDSAMLVDHFWVGRDDG